MAKVEVTMPKMGESITEGTVITWYKQPGDAVELDETLLEIGTDKVDTEVPSPAAGVLKEIVIPEGETVDVGTVIAVLETSVDAANEPVEAPASPAAEPAAEAPAAPAPSNNGGGQRVPVVMPKMGESITEGTVLTWHKQPGDTVELDETLLEVGTDKVDTEVPAVSAGTVVEILVPEGETVPVGTEIAIIATGEGEAVATPAPAPSTPAPSTPVADAPSGDGAPMAEPAPAGGPSLPRRGSDGRFYSPLVRSIAEKEGVTEAEMLAIRGSGREGRITKKDILAHVERRTSGPAVAPAPTTTFTQPVKSPQEIGAGGSRVEVVEMDRMRQIIAEHMVRSKATSAHVTSFTEIDVTNLVRLREKNKTMFLEREGVKLSFTPFLVYAAVNALRDHPVINSSVQDKQIILKKDYHIGIAVAIDTSRLVVPVIRNAGEKNIAGLAKAAADLASRARGKKLQPDDLQGGTFTVTNIGSIGSLMGTPIINQPQVAILATGAIKKRPVVVEDPNLGDIIAIRHMMYVSLSYDHRVIDGAMASSFLRRYTGILEGVDPNGTV